MKEFGADFWYNVKNVGIYLRKSPPCFKNENAPWPQAKFFYPNIIGHFHWFHCLSTIITTEKKPQRFEVAEEKY